MATREEIQEQERNAAHPRLLRVANFLIVLSGALFLSFFLFGFVMYMNAREDARQESTGTYRARSFYVEQVYFQKGKPGGPAGGRSDTRAFARGFVEGNEEYTDLIPYLRFIPKDEETVQKIVRPGTVLRVYYNAALKGEYRVRLLGSVSPAELSRRAASGVAKYVLPVLALTGAALIACLRLRRFSLGSV